MRKPTVSYRGFRLSRLREPQFSHLLLLLGWIVYFMMYFLTENLIPAERCHPIHCFVDDIVPFCEFFVIFYVGWYLLIVASLLYFLCYDVEQFKNLQTFIIITQVVATVVYILYPSRQDLRPLEFERENIFTGLVGLIYSLDTNTGVCPSLHVAYSLGIASVWLKEKSVSAGFKAFMVILVTLICLSVLFIKQHSAVDVLAAVPVALLAEWLVFGRRKNRRKSYG